MGGCLRCELNLKLLYIKNLLRYSESWFQIDNIEKMVHSGHSPWGMVCITLYMLVGIRLFPHGLVGLIFVLNTDYDVKSAKD